MMLQRRGTSALGVISLPPTFLISLPARLLVLLRRLNLAFLALVFFVFTMMMRPLLSGRCLRTSDASPVGNPVVSEGSLPNHPQFSVRALVPGEC